MVIYSLSTFQIRDRPLTYRSAVKLVQFVEALPSPPRWKAVTLTFKDHATTEPIVLYHRDAEECMRMLFSSPRFCGHMDFAPRRVFVDGKRQYTEMSTGNRWWDIQVRLFHLSS
jgi:hypothetical protein